MLSNVKMLAWNTREIGVRARPTEDKSAALGSEFKSVWVKEFKACPVKLMVAMA